MAEWQAIFQNVFVNAVNAMLDAKRKKIVVRSHASRRERTILIMDTGTGVDLKKADDLFKPFVRRTRISADREQLGVGGAGLGLTIVRMIADTLGATIGFYRSRAVCV